MLRWLPFVLQSVQTTDTVALRERLCQACRISASVVATLATDNGGAVDRNTLVARDARGNYWIASQRISARGRIDVFDALGRRLRSLGRIGSGPGEFRFISLLAPSPVGVEVFDVGNGRWTTIGLDYQVERIRPVSVQPRSAVFTGSIGVLAAHVGTTEAIGKTLHVIDTAGQIVRSFSEPPLPFQPYLPNPFYRTLSPSTDSVTLWSAHRGEYVFERCDFVSTRCVTYARSAAWFRPHLGILEPHREKAPLPLLAGVSHDGPDGLWTAILVADPRWKEAVEQAPGTRGSDGLLIGDFSKYFDTIVERIDLKTGNVVASSRIDAAILQFLAPGMGFSYREDTSGLPRVDILKLTYLQSR